MATTVSSQNTPAKTVVVSKPTKSIKTQAQVITSVVADVGQSGAAGAAGAPGAAGANGAAGAPGDPGVFVGATAPADTSLVWVDTSMPSTARETGYYGSLYSTETQYCISADVPFPIRFTGLDASNGITLTNNSRINIAHTGVYNFQWSGQFFNHETAPKDVRVWISIDGTPWDGSTGLVNIPAAKNASAGNEGHTIVGWNFIKAFTAGQYFEFIWSSELISNGTTTGVTIRAIGAVGTPGTPNYSPSTSSVVATIQEV